MPPTKTPPPHEAVPLRTTTRPLRRVKFLQGGRRSTPPTHALTNKNPCMVFVWAPQKGRRSWIDLNQGAPQHTNHLRHQFLCLRVWKGRQQWNAIISSWISIHPSIHSSIYLQLCFKKKKAPKNTPRILKEAVCFSRGTSTVDEFHIRIYEFQGTLHLGPIQFDVLEVKQCRKSVDVFFFKSMGMCFFGWFMILGETDFLMCIFFSRGMCICKYVNVYKGLMILGETDF